MQRVRIEWDAEKDRLNLRKHGVSFDVAARVFDDPGYLLVEDRVDETGEMRWHAVGFVDTVLLLVVHVYRTTLYGEEILRIISARKVGKREGRRYFQ